jgi:bacteriocin biosynthesis cyclodehydratase domain-containing protein
MSSGLLSRVFQLKRHLRAAPWDDSRVFLVGEEQQFLLTGKAYGLVVPHIDGQRTVAAIASALEGMLSPSEVVYAVMALDTAGYVTDVGEVPATDSDGFWSAIGVDPLQARANLASVAVAVEGVHPRSQPFDRRDDAACLAHALEQTGVRIADSGAVHVLVTDDYLSAEAHGMHLRAQREGLRWMPVKPRGRSAWIGPIFAPGAACWACLASRLRLNRPVHAYFERHGRPRPAGPVVGIASSIEGAIQWTAAALARWIAEGSRSEAAVLDTSLVALDANSLTTSKHPVVRRPQCPDCGDPGLYARSTESPVRLVSVPRQVTDDGGYRMQSPDDTVARLSVHVSPITGLVASLEPMRERSDALRHVFAGTYRVCPTGDTPSANDFHKYSAGKGRSPAQARASALCEALERQGATFQGDEPRVAAKIADLGDEAVHPDRLQEFSDAQRASRSGGSRANDARQAIPPPFDEHAVVDWTPAWSLTNERRRWLPLTYCYLLVPPPKVVFCPFNPNGHAAGNCLEEAVLQGFLELVERDAVGIWWYNRLARPAVDLASFGEPYFLALNETYSALGWTLWVLDLTNDLKIPAFVALARAKEDRRFCVGFGCHLDARLGVQRALTELNQLFDPAAARSPWGDGEGTHNVDYLFPSGDRPSARTDFPAPPKRDLRGDVLACVARAADAGLETMVIDQTRPDVDLSVVKVVVPGLRHFWPRLGPGRLYDVPVTCGWLPRPRLQTELNPVPLLL